MTTATEETRYAAKDSAHERYRLLTSPASIELHINTNPAFTRKYGKKVRAVGGSYSEARGNTSRRFVEIPITDETKTLIDEISANHKATVMILRGCRIDVPAWVVVYNKRGGERTLKAALEHFWSSAASAAQRGILLEVTEAEVNERAEKVDLANKRAVLTRFIEKAERLSEEASALGLDLGVEDAVKTAKVKLAAIS